MLRRFELGRISFSWFQPMRLSRESISTSYTLVLKISDGRYWRSISAILQLWEERFFTSPLQSPCREFGTLVGSAKSTRECCNWLQSLRFLLLEETPAH